MARFTKRASADVLTPFILRNVEGLDGNNIEGSGSYGIVYKVTVKGMQCIAKRLHSILLDKVASDGREAMKKKFRNECVMLSKLRHPNVVHFLGVHYARNKDLTLIMEELHTDLAKFVESKPNLALSIKLSMLLDVTYGLLYLHSLIPPMIHRDLTAPNILLTSDLRAKIADLGVAKLIDPTTQSTILQTQTPGAQNYMPPEALMENPVYSEKLDIFSFGHLSLYTVNQTCPDVFNVELTPRMLKDSMIEIMKRQKALLQMGETHPLYPVVKQCLSDKPEKRPSTTELHTQLQELCGKTPKSLDSVPQALGFSACDLKEELRLANKELADKSEKLQTLLSDLALTVQLKNEALEREDIYKQQAAVFEADFKEERKDRERAHSMIEDSVGKLQKESKDLTKKNEDLLVENRHLKDQMAAVMMHNRLLQSTVKEHQNSPKLLAKHGDMHEQMDKFAQCLLLKEEGNTLYKAGEHHKAADKYHEALIYLEELTNNEEPHSSTWNRIMETKIVLSLNFSQCKLLLGEYSEVIRHTSSILEFDSENVKALFRRGRAHAALCNVDKARADFEAVVRLDCMLARSVEKELASLQSKIKDREKQEEKQRKEKLLL